MAAWRIYYSDGSTFDSDDGSAEDAPSTGVICVKQKNPLSTWTLVSMRDYYLWHDGQWWEADTPGFWQYMFKSGAKVALFGESVPDEVFNDVINRARDDADFGEKSSIHLRERERPWQ